VLGGLGGVRGEGEGGKGGLEAEEEPDCDEEPEGEEGVFATCSVGELDHRGGKGTSKYMVVEVMEGGDNWKVEESNEMRCACLPYIGTPVPGQGSPRTVPSGAK
ncbi:hypothetical protein V498_01177, partial [Pseudogymnoascus sp. VKM F-4517 (FW-2822)]